MLYLNKLPMVLVCTLILFSCTSKSNNPQPNQTIRIGEVTTLSGSEANYGLSGHQGASLAIKEINERGGIQGKLLELITLDDRGSPEETVTAATKLLSHDHVVALTGALPSSRGISITPIAQKFKIPMVSSASTHPQLTHAGNYIFKTCFTDPFQGYVMAKFVLENLKIRRVALLKDVKSDYSVGLSENFIQTFKKGGGEILIEQSYGSGDIDFKGQLTAIRAKQPDAIFIPGYYTEGALIARQAKELGIQVPLLGGDGWDSPSFVQIGGDAVNNTFYSTHYFSGDQSPLVQDFIKKYKTAYNSVPDGLATLGYDAILVLADAIKRAKSLDPQDIRNALESTHAFPAVTGNITFDQDRNPIKAGIVVKIEHGKILYSSKVMPE